MLDHLDETEPMGSYNSSASAGTLIGVGLDVLPWIALAVGSSFYSPSLLSPLLPYSRLVLPVLVLVIGSLVFLERRQGVVSSRLGRSPSTASSEADQVRLHGLKAPSAPDSLPQSVSAAESISVDQPVLITSRTDHTILVANEGFEREFGYAQEDLIGNTPSDVGMWSGDDTEKRVRKHLSPKAPMQNEPMSMQTADGALRHIPLHLDLASDDQTEYLVWQFSVGRSRQGPQSRHGEGKKYDALTGLATRSSLLRQVSQRLDRNSDEEDGPALFSLTISEYGDVMESFGYNAGQQFLTAAASRIEDAKPSAVTAARISESTFAALLPGASEDRARELGRTLLKAFDTPFQIAGQQVPVEAILGLAVRSGARSRFSEAAEMLQASYSAMHRGKREDPTSNLNIYQDGDRTRTHRLHRRERLRTAVHQDELVLHYQPIVHLATREVVGAEALVRWNHPERGLLMPAAFMPLAEETGLVREIDRWVFERGLYQTSEWTQSPAGPVDWVSVNVSPQSVDDSFQDWCRDKLRDIPISEGGLHLEITEQRALHGEQFLRQLRDEGVHLAIDDFGTGYSSLRYLRYLNAELLKIDREFIQDLGQDSRATAIVQFLLNLSLRLGVEVIAEGVETTDQENTLRELGCAMAQGYRFSKPIPADALVEYAGRVPDQPATSQSESQRSDQENVNSTPGRP